MSETPESAPPLTSPVPEATAPPSRPPLRRLKSDRVLGGVCSGVARSLGVDPVLVRVIVVILTLFAGGGVLVYLAAWLLIPEEGRDDSVGHQLVGSRNTQTALIVVIAVIVALSIAVPSGIWMGSGPHFVAPGFLLMIAAIALVVWLLRRDAPTAAPPPPNPNEGTAMSPPTHQQTMVLPAPPGGAPPAVTSPAVAPPPPKPARPRSVLGLLTLSAAAMVVGLLVTVNLAVEDANISSTTVLGAALATVALGLLIGTRYGRSRGLIVLGVLLAIATAISSALPSVDLSEGVGDRTWRPQSAADVDRTYELAIGQATLDLRDLAVPSTGIDTPITASLGIGELMVLLPPDVDVQLTADVGLGRLDIAGTSSGGSDREITTFIDVPDQTGTIALDLEAGIGHIVVRHALDTPRQLPDLRPLPNRGDFQ